MRKFLVLLEPSRIPELTLEHWLERVELPTEPDYDDRQQHEFPYDLVRSLHGPGHQVTLAAPDGFNVRVKHHRLPRIPFDAFMAAGWHVSQVQEFDLSKRTYKQVALGELPRFVDAKCFKLYADWQLMGGGRMMREVLRVKKIYPSDCEWCLKCKQWHYPRKNDPVREAVFAREPYWVERERHELRA